jgi:hypothetical protein
MKTAGVRLWCVLALAIGASALAPAAMADTILNFQLGTGATLSGNATTPPTAFCVTTSNCPGSPSYGLALSEPVTGTVSFDLGTGSTGTMSFDLTLAQNATLGSVVIDAGSTIIGSGVNVNYSSSTSKGVTTYTITPGSPAATVAVNLLPGGSSFTETASQPIIPGIVCSASSANGACTFTIGTPQGAAQSLLINVGGTTYNGVLGLSAPLVPVPLPAGAFLLLGGLAPVMLRARRRTAR